MRWWQFGFLAIACVCFPEVSLAQQVPATALDACQTTSPGGGYRWAARTDAQAPARPNQVIRTSVAQILTWAPLTAATPTSVDLPRQPGFEQQFSFVQGSLERVELDSAGDVRLELSDEDDASAPRVVALIPQGDAFCPARSSLFDTLQVDPTAVPGGAAPVWVRDDAAGPHTFKPVVVELVGRPFYDGQRCQAQASSAGPGAATCWELSPVLQLTAAESGSQPPAAQSDVPPDAQPQVNAAVTDAAAVTGQDQSGISVSKVQAVDWPDSGLGCPRPGMAYLEVITPGWLIELQAGASTLEYHADTGSNVVLCSVS